MRFLLLFLVIFAIQSCSMHVPVKDKTEGLIEIKDWNHKLFKTDASFKIYREVDGNWWKQFNDPQLSKLIALSDEAYATRMLQIDIERSELILGIAKSDYYPKAQVSANIAQSSDPSNRANNIDSALSSNVGLSASWEIDVWGKVKSQVKASNNLYLQQIELLRDSLVTIQTTIARYYFEYVILDKKKSLLLKNKENTLAILEQAKFSYENDLASIEQYNDMRIKIIEIEESILNLDNAKESILLGIANLLSMTIQDVKNIIKDTSMDVEIPQSLLLPPPVDTLRQRSDVRNAEYQLVVAISNAQVAKANRLPSFSLTGILGFSNTRLNISNTTNSVSGPNYNFGLGVGWNIFAAGALKRNYQSSVKAIEKSRLNYQNTVLKAVNEVNSSLFVLDQQMKVLTSISEAQNLNKEQMELDKNKYELEIENNTNLLLDEITVNSRGIEIFDTQLLLLKGIINMYKSVGGAPYTPKYKQLLNKTNQKYIGDNKDE